MSLFAEDDAWIKARLRLTSVPVSAEDTHAIIDEGISNARLAFYRRLGRLAVQNVLDIPEVAEPSTDDQVLRTLASLTEVKLVRVFLLRELPNAFMDASGDLNKRWNEEAAFRERPRSNLEKEIIRLNEEIEQAMQELEQDGDESPGDVRQVYTFDGTPEDPSAIPLPGDSLFPRNTRFINED